MEKSNGLISLFTLLDFIDMPFLCIHKQLIIQKSMSFRCTRFLMLFLYMLQVSEDSKKYYQIKLEKKKKSERMKFLE